MIFIDDDLKSLEIWLNYPKNISTKRRESILRLISRLEAAEKCCDILDQIYYCFQNIWSLDRKKFESQFVREIKNALDAWRKSKGE